jgi:AcrR family transcriptional regulator
VPKVSPTYLDARRNEILDAAWTCFARKGYHQTTMQDICAEAEMSAGALYRYFPRKEDILVAINERSLDMGRRLVQEASSRADDPLDALRLIGQTMLGALRSPVFEDMSRVSVEIWPEVLRNEKLREALREELSFWASAVTDILRQAKSRGELGEHVDPEAAARLYMCAYEGLRHYLLVSPDQFKPELLVELGRAFSPAGSSEWIVDEIPATIVGVPLGTRYPRIQRNKSRTTEATGGANRKPNARGRAHG